MMATMAKDVCPSKSWARRTAANMEQNIQAVLLNSYPSSAST